MEHTEARWRTQYVDVDGVAHQGPVIIAANREQAQALVASFLRGPGGEPLVVDERYVRQQGIHNFKDMAGQVFGRLTVVRRDGIGSPVYWICDCACGNRVSVDVKHLRRGITRSCGCLRRESLRQRARNLKRSRTPTYSSWRAMMRRCFNPESDQYANYGGRGITVAPEFRTYEGFVAIIGDRPPNMTLDRIDVNGHYEPGNVRWATARQQAANKRIAKHLTGGVM